MNVFFAAVLLLCKVSITACLVLLFHGYCFVAKMATAKFIIASESESKFAYKLVF